jgi:hypothetical protein
MLIPILAVLCVAALAIRFVYKDRQEDALIRQQFLSDDRDGIERAPLLARNETRGAA